MAPGEWLRRCGGADCMDWSARALNHKTNSVERDFFRTYIDSCLLPQEPEPSLTCGSFKIFADPAGESAHALDASRLARVLWPFSHLGLWGVGSVKVSDTGTSVLAQLTAPLSLKMYSTSSHSQWHVSASCVPEVLCA